MSETLLIAILQLIVKVGIPAAATLLESLTKPGVTIDEAIAALRAAEKKSAKDYLDEATKTK
jgi:hypothetical protein